MTAEASTGRTRVLVLSTLAFTLLFAVWLMFGILGKPIREEFGLSEIQLSWIIAAARPSLRAVSRWPGAIPCCPRCAHHANSDSPTSRTPAFA